MKKYMIVKNGRDVVARADTIAEIRDIGLGLIRDNPRASFELCQVRKRVYGTYVPPSYDVVEEDIP